MPNKTSCQDEHTHAVTTLRVTTKVGRGSHAPVDRIEMDNTTLSSPLDFAKWVHFGSS